MNDFLINIFLFVWDWAPYVLTPLFVVYLLSLLINSVQVVSEWNRRPVMRFGKYHRTLEPGINLINPITQNALDDETIADQIDTLKIESTQTHDNVPMSFVFVLTYRIIKDRVRDYVVNLQDDWMTRAIATANEQIGARTLDQILNDRETLTVEIRKALQWKVKNWGLDIEALEIQDFQIEDESIQKSIAMKARAQKEAEGELKRAEMQQSIAKELNKAGDVLDAGGWRLKEFETLIELCRSANNNTIVIPTGLGSLMKNLTKGAKRD